MAMLKLPPGIRFIFSKSAFALATCGLSYGLTSLLELKIGISLPGAVKLCFLPFAYPIFIISRNAYETWKFKREATQLGAVLIPVYKGKWPGNVDLMIQFMKELANTYVLDAFGPIAQELGPIFMLNILWSRRPPIFTTEPEHTKQILCTEFDNFLKGKDLTDFCYPLLGVGVFNSDGDLWKFHRAMTRPFFHRERISDFDIFSEHADTALARIKARVRAGYALDMQDLFSRFTLDSASTFLFGHNANSLHQDLPYPHNAQLPTSRSTMSNEGDQCQNTAEQLTQAFMVAQSAISGRWPLGPFWELAEFWTDRVEEPVNVFYTFIEPILEKAIRRKRDKEAAGLPEKKDEIDDGETPLDYLVKHSEDRVLLRDEIINIMIAGRDTTASTMTSLLYMLSMHPGVLRCLRAEILDVVGPTRSPTLEDVRKMKFLRAVINETLRLYPPVPIDIRQSIKATTLSNPIKGGKPLYCPPGTGITYCISMMHRRKDLWGPDADEFDPDRFIDERLHKYLTPNPFIFLPFNAGPRICLGQQFAYNEISFMIVGLLQTFDAFELDADAQPADAVPPPEWKDKEGRQSVERVLPKAHLSLFVHGFGFAFTKHRVDDALSMRSDRLLWYCGKCYNNPLFQPSSTGRI